MRTYSIADSIAKEFEELLGEELLPRAAVLQLLNEFLQDHQFQVEMKDRLVVRFQRVLDQSKSVDE